MKYRRKAKYIDAFQYDGLFMKDSTGKLHISGDIPEWAREALADGRLYFHAWDLYTHNDELGDSCVMRNEFIVMDADGGIHNLPPETFTRIYERCPDEPFE